MMIVRRIQNTSSGRLLRVLLDSGSTKTMIKDTALPKGCAAKVLYIHWKRIVNLQEILLPEFNRSLTIDLQPAYVFEGGCRYDLIRKRFPFDFDLNMVRWMG